jgi:hypothetical protein
MPHKKKTLDSSHTPPLSHPELLNGSYSFYCTGTTPITSPGWPPPAPPAPFVAVGFLRFDGGGGLTSQSLINHGGAVKPVDPATPNLDPFTSEASGTYTAFQMGDFGYAGTITLINLAPRLPIIIFNYVMADDRKELYMVQSFPSFPPGYPPPTTNTGGGPLIPAPSFGGAVILIAKKK